MEQESYYSNFDQNQPSFSKGIKKYRLSLFCIFALSIGLAIALYQSQQTQEIRQRASTLSQADLDALYIERVPRYDYGPLTTSGPRKEKK